MINKARQRYTPRTAFKKKLPWALGGIRTHDTPRSRHAKEAYWHNDTFCDRMSNLYDVATGMCRQKASGITCIYDFLTSGTVCT